jgi:DNA-binding MarR family transcriptional regulator
MHILYKYMSKHMQLGRVSMDASKPLGYWLKHLHNLLDEHLGLVLSEQGTGRREWQLLNTLARGSRPRADLERDLAPFWLDEPSLPRVLATLAARGWIMESGGTVELTPAGRAGHAALVPRVERTRAVVTAGLTPEQYQETVRILAVMAGNVEQAIRSGGGAPAVRRAAAQRPPG